MTEKKKNIEPESAHEEQPINTSSVLRGVLDGTLLTRKAVQKQLPFLLFIAFIGLLYISNRYHADKVRREIVSLKLELGELRAHALFTSSELMKMGRQTEVAEIVKKYNLDLKESEDPPKKIKVSRIPGK
jgi:cell division protein FtsL